MGLAVLNVFVISQVVDAVFRQVVALATVTELHIRIVLLGDAANGTFVYDSQMVVRTGLTVEPASVGRNGSAKGQSFVDVSGKEQDKVKERH